MSAIEFIFNVLFSKIRIKKSHKKECEMNTKSGNFPIDKGLYKIANVRLRITTIKNSGNVFINKGVLY